VGVVATTQYSIERDLKMAPGDSEELAGYRFDFQLRRCACADRTTSLMAPAFRVPRRPGSRLLLAEKRRYLASGSVMTEAAIDAGLFRDLYVAMGEPVGTRGRLGDTPALQAHGALDVARRNWRWVSADC
jgi:cytochrome c-type biogenesis protein CcmF